MKTLQCYDCNKTFRAKKSDDMLNLMYKHYMDMHRSIITSVNESKKKIWMERFHTDWDKAERIWKP